MFTTKEIWAAGRAALGLSDTPAASTTASVVASPLAAARAVSASDVFDPAAFGFEPRTYRIHFKNGLSGEYDGAQLATVFPFDPAQIDTVEPIEDVGRGA